MQNITHYILVSSEDDQYLVKGGIGTYTGVLTRAIRELFPEIKVSWLTESHNGQDFDEVDCYGVERHYISRLENDSLQDFAKKLNTRTEQLIEGIQEQGDYKIIVESPEWEGLLTELFCKLDDPNILKVSRIHTPLAVTSVLNNIQLEDEQIQQMAGEKLQMLASDFLSSPTQYVLDATIEKVFDGDIPSIPSKVIPNCIDIDKFLSNEILSRNESIQAFKEGVYEKISSDNFNIFVVGSVEKRKGSDIVMNSVETVCKEIPNAHFYFLGHYLKDDGNSLTSNKKLTPESLLSNLPKELHDRVNFVGYVDHSLLPKLMNAGDLFPICYLGDNFPGVVAEIALSERPMSAFLRGGVPEMVKSPTGEYLTSCFSSEDTHTVSKLLSDSIISVYNDTERATSHAQALKNHMIKTFSKKNVVGQMFDQYSKLLEK